MITNIECDDEAIYLLCYSFPFTFYACKFHDGLKSDFVYLSEEEYDFIQEYMDWRDSGYSKRIYEKYHDRGIEFTRNMEVSLRQIVHDGSANSIL